LLLLLSPPRWAALATAGTGAWLAFAYVTVFSMFIGFFFWYRGLALGGVARVGQVQLLQPFLSLAGAALLLGEPLTLAKCGFALAVVAVVFVGRTMQVKH
jgi:drug/metabolite transporter (DMT)-like permease